MARAAALYFHSTANLGPFDPLRPYSPDALEAYDALLNRCERAIELFLKFFRTVEAFETAGAWWPAFMRMQAGDDLTAAEQAFFGVIRREPLHLGRLVGV